MAKLPFWMLPGSWGLVGKTRKIAEAEYYLSGYELEIELARINNNDPNKLKRELLDIDRSHDKISEYEYDQEVAKLDHADEIKQKLAIVDVDLKHEKISKTEHEKQTASILGEPWVSMPKISWDPLNKNKTFFELDYNEHFIKYLKDNGYNGTEDEIMNQWLNDVCISVIEEINDIDVSLATPSRRERNNTEQ